MRWRSRAGKAKGANLHRDGKCSGLGGWATCRQRAARDNRKRTSSPCHSTSVGGSPEATSDFIAYFCARRAPGRTHTPNQFEMVQVAACAATCGGKEHMRLEVGAGQCCCKTPQQESPRYEGGKFAARQRQQTRDRRKHTRSSLCSASTGGRAEDIPDFFDYSSAGPAPRREHTQNQLAVLWMPTKAA